ncbi:MAG TPA: hypothetical protein VHL53_20955 [Acidimicrobiia bacterium]|nr:hypothetical protein [Acidimicrobiia bacterium]
MRRTTASIVVTLGLFAASLAWWSFAARFTVLDSDRSARIADVLSSQPVIQDAVAEGLGTALEQALPPGTPITAAEVSAAAHRALADPRATAAIRTAIVDSHQRLLGGYDGPVTLDVTPIADAGRDALLAARPDLAGSLPAAPPLSIDLPTQHLPKLGWLPQRTRELGGLAGFLAVALLGLGMVLAADRPKVLGRAGRWALRAGLGCAAFGWAVPWALSKVGEPRLAALGAIGVACVGPLIAPAVTLVCGGVGALIGARAWRLALAALPPAPPASGPGTDPRTGWTGTAARGTGSWDPIPPLPGRRPAPRPEGEPVPSGRANPFSRPRRPGDGSSHEWWA